MPDITNDGTTHFTDGWTVAKIQQTLEKVESLEKRVKDLEDKVNASTSEGS